MGGKGRPFPGGGNIQIQPNQIRRQPVVDTKKETVRPVIDGRIGKLTRKMPAPKGYSLSKKNLLFGVLIIQKQFYDTV
jgi:hypothetical protein